MRNVRLKRATECAVFLFKGDAQMEILARRFGKKIKLPPTVQIKREILLRWLADQTEIEAAEARKDRFETGVGMLKGGAKADSNCGV